MTDDILLNIRDALPKTTTFDDKLLMAFKNFIEMMIKSVHWLTPPILDSRHPFGLDLPFDHFQFCVIRKPVAYEGNLQFLTLTIIKHYFESCVLNLTFCFRSREDFVRYDGASLQQRRRFENESGRNGDGALCDS